MKTNKTCPKCGGERMEVDIGVGIELGPCLQCGYGNLATALSDLEAELLAASEAARGD